MKGNQEPMLYTTNATVAALNHVPGFDPLKFLRRTISRKTGEDVMRLDLRYKKLWFRLALKLSRLTRELLYLFTPSSTPLVSHNSKLTNG